MSRGGGPHPGDHWHSPSVGLSCGEEMLKGREEGREIRREEGREEGRGEGREKGREERQENGERGIKGRCEEGERGKRKGGGRKWCKKGNYYSSYKAKDGQIIISLQ